MTKKVILIPVTVINPSPRYWLSPKLLKIYLKMYRCTCTNKIPKANINFVICLHFVAGFQCNDFGIFFPAFCNIQKILNNIIKNI